MYNCGSAHRCQRLFYARSRARFDPKAATPASSSPLSTITEPLFSLVARSCSAAMPRRSVVTYRRYAAPSAPCPSRNSPGRTSDITEAVHWDAGVEVRVYSFREGVHTKIRPFGPHRWLVCGVVAPCDEPWTCDHAVRRRADTTHTPRS